MLIIKSASPYFSLGGKINFLLVLYSNHGYKTSKQALETDSAASCGLIYPPLCGIVQLTNAAALRFWNSSFTISLSRENYCNIIKNKMHYVRRLIPIS